MFLSSYLLCGYLVIVHAVEASAFVQTSSAASRCTACSSRIHAIIQRSEDDKVSSVNADRDVAIASSSATSSTVESYEYDGWNLTYRYRPALAGHERDPPVLLIHPVGIGLASWFWEPLMEAWEGPALYAPNLIGCGCISEGGDAWDPDDRGLFIPLGWVQGCEALMDHVAERGGSGGGVGGPQNDSQKQPLEERSSAFSSPPTTFFKNFPPRFLSGASTKSSTWTVVTQGGLAPIGVLLASRNPTKVGNLVMASPPSWKDMTTPVPEEELSRNYNFLRSPTWGGLAFRMLESRMAVDFFSNQFLFADPCDATWLDKVERELGVLARPPVQVFNAGFCTNRGLGSELTALNQPTLIVQGIDDKRRRQEYVDKMKSCQIETLPGKNVVPWEYPEEFAKLLSTRITR
jgi:pimeloyl-ACP methyl ester carboxylesterase